MDAPFVAESLVLPLTETVSQYVDRHRPRRNPLQRLAYAIIDLTLHDLGLAWLMKKKPGRPVRTVNEGLIARKSRNFKDACAWVTDIKADSLFSFRSVCEILAIEPDRFRAGIIALLDERSIREAA